MKHMYPYNQFTKPTKRHVFREGDAEARSQAAAQRLQKELAGLQGNTPRPEAGDGRQRLSRAQTDEHIKARGGKDAFRVDRGPSPFEQKAAVAAAFAEVQRAAWIDGGPEEPRTRLAANAARLHQLQKDAWVEGSGETPTPPRPREEVIITSARKSPEVIRAEKRANRKKTGFGRFINRFTELFGGNKAV